MKTRRPNSTKQAPTFTLLQGDATKVLRQYFQPDSFDGCSCDPPYGFTAFAGKKHRTMDWEKEDVPGVELWTEVHRVLRPGALLVAAAGARTYHRLATAVEIAGFHILDQFNWLYTGANATGVTEGYRLRPAFEPYVIARKPAKDGKLRGHYNTSVRVGDPPHVPTDVALDPGAAQLLDVLTGRATSSFFFCGKAHGAERQGHDHPTPKPLALTQHLATLIRQPGATKLLVPFSGVGSEIVGAFRAGWSSVTGVERETKYIRAARSRIPRFVDGAVEG